MTFHEDPGRSSGLFEAVPLVFDLLSHLEKAQDAHRALTALVGEFSDLTVDEIAVRLNITSRHADLLVRGSTFKEFLLSIVHDGVS